MNDTPNTLPATLDSADWANKDREYFGRAEALLAVNKTVLFDGLAAAGITCVMVTFDGSGDSGQMETIEARAGDVSVDLPSGMIEIATPVWDSTAIERRGLSIHDAIETLAYAVLGQTHGGWENSEGAYGDFTFAVAERTITLDYNERHLASDYSQHVL